MTIESPAITEITLSGPGAGGSQTASAVLGDLVSAMIPPPTLPAPAVEAPLVLDVESAFYLHLEVEDRPGVLATITEILGKNEVSVRSVVQRGQGGDAQLIMVMHRGDERNFHAALKRIATLKALRAKPRAIRVIEEEFT